MKTLRSLTLAIVALLLPAELLAAQADADTYRCYKQLFYGRTDGLCLSVSDYTLNYMVNGTSVYTISPAGTIITLANGGTISNATNGALIFGEASEDLALTFTGNLATFSSSTGATVAFTPAVALSDSLTLSDGLVIDQTANGNLSITEAAEDIVLTFTSNDVAMTSTTSVSRFDFGTINVETDQVNADGTGTLTLLINGEDMVGTGTANLITWDSTTSATFAFTPQVAFGAMTQSATNTLGASGKIDALTNSAFVLAYNDVIKFCGNGGGAGAAGATTYIGPNAGGDIFGSAACDGYESDTETTADNVVSPQSFKAYALRCGMLGAGGNDDVITFQARDDAGSITGLTCPITLAGATYQTCSVGLTTAVTVTAGSALAVQISTVATGGADDLDAVDAQCELFVTK